MADLALPERYLQTALAVQVSVRQVCRALSLRDEREHEALTVAPTLHGRAATPTGAPGTAPRHRFRPLVTALA